MNFGIIFKILATIFSVMLCVFLCGVAAAFITSDDLTPFAYSAGLSLICAILFRIVARLKNITISKKDAYLSVVLAWLSICFIGTMPYLFLSNEISFTEALFESVAGFTTTGATVLKPVITENLPKSFLFWRCFSNWIGGIGVVMIVIVIMPSLNAGGYKLFSLESSMQEKMLPRINEVVWRFILIYLVMTMAGIGLLYAGDMDIFDSVCYGISSISTGGTSADNVSNFSAYSQCILIVLMLLGGTTFGIFYAVAKGRFQRVFRNEELHAYLRIILVAGALVAGIFIWKTDRSIETSVLEGLFSVVSVVSCTGLSAGDFAAYPFAVSCILFILMFVGGCSGSTSGGIKIFRFVILFKNIRVIFDSILHPNHIRKVNYNGKDIDDTMNISVLLFIFIYVTMVLIGSLLLVFLGLNGKEAFNAIAMSMSSFGITFGDLTTYSTSIRMVLCFFMILGRLEIYPLLILFIPTFWKKL